MKKVVEKWSRPLEHSFIVKQIDLSNDSDKPQEVVMRMHDDYEISVISGGSGKRIIGNSIENFSGIDMFFIGSNVFHSIQLDGKTDAQVMTIHFLPKSFGDVFFCLPENKKIKNLLEQSKLGLSFDATVAKHYYKIFKDVLSEPPFTRMISFFTILQELALVEEKKPLSTYGFDPTANKKNYKRVDMIYNYVLSRFNDEEDITLDQIARYVDMAPATFCRYFKTHFHKTFTCFLNEVRIGHACKMLQETNMSIAEIAFASGYNHLTHFNRQFKKFMGYSPKAYRRELNQ